MFLGGFTLIYNERLLDVSELCRYLHIGRNRAYELCKQYDFPSFKIGSKIFVDKEKLELWLKNQQEITH